MLADILLLILSLVLLTAGAEVLVRGAVVLALRLGVSSFFIGLTIVGFGTSAPELATGIAAGLNGKPDIVMGNVVGSNILNIALILGVASLIRPTPVKTHLVKVEVLAVIAISIVVWVLSITGHAISRVEGAALFAILILFLIRGYIVGKREGADVDPVVETIAKTADDPTPAHPTLRLRLSKSALFNAALVVVGLVILTLSSRLLVDSASSIARTLGVSELVIALTIVAGGTSMPELATSVMAAIRKQSDIAVGNILGSNIFNLCCILGIVSMIAPPAVSEQILWLDAPIMIVLAIALLPILFTGSRISRGEGVALLAVAVLYTVTLFTLAPRWFPQPTAEPDQDAALSLVAYTPAPDISPDAIHSLEAADLHNVLRYGTGVVGGSAPDSVAQFDALAAMGVKTILSVDGATPMVDVAEARGMRYIHVPTQYAGVGTKESLQLAKALRDAPRPIYVHCHHGKHRGPAAAALALVQLGEIDNEVALQLLVDAGTSPSYPGLYACVREARPVDDATLNDPGITLPSAAAVSGMVGHMAAVDRHFDNLKILRAAEWAVPGSHPDLVPVSEAGVIENHLRSLLSDLSMLEYDEAFMHEMRESQILAQLLEDALVQGDLNEATAHYDRLAASCSRCHQVYRNEVAVE